MGGGTRTVFRANAPRVISETAGGEAIMIDLVSGDYFSLNETGTAIWTLIEASASQAEILAALASRYDGAHEELESAVQSFLGDLEREELIVLADNGDRPAVSYEPNGTRDRGAFVRPQLEKFSDMQDLILIDPVHEVSERGWPHAAPHGDSA